MKKITLFLLLALPSVSLCGGCQNSATAGHPQTGTFLLSFGGTNPVAHDANLHVNSDLDPAVEKYFLYVPPGYDGSEGYGLIVFTNASDRLTQLPAGWGDVLNARKYIFVAAQNVGNDQPRGRRLGLAVMGALKTKERYRINPNRVYAAGFSGGARMAGMLGFYRPDIFQGTLQNCGADFYRPVAVVHATSQLDTAGNRYGVIETSEEEVRRAKAVRFVLVTGTNDFRRGNILDIFHGGFEQDGFQAKLFDIPGMAHDICDGVTLSQALDFLEKGL